MQDLLHKLLNIDVKLSADPCSSTHFKFDEMGQAQHPTPLSHVDIGHPLSLKRIFLVQLQNQKPVSGHSGQKPAFMAHIFYSCETCAKKLCIMFFDLNFFHLYVGLFSLTLADIPLACPDLSSPHLYTLLKQISFQSFDFHAYITDNTIALVITNQLSVCGISCSCMLSGTLSPRFAVSIVQCWITH